MVVLVNQATPEHQRKTLARLYKLWRKNPSLRLGQLIENVFPCENEVPKSNCFYHNSDEEFLSTLESFYQD